MDSYLPRRHSCCNRILKATAPLSPASRLTQARRCAPRQRSQRLAVNAFLFNMVTGSGSSTSKEAVSSRLSELRRRSEEEDRAFLSEQLSDDTEHQEDASLVRRDGESEMGALDRATYGPWPAEAGSEEAGLAPGGAMTARSMRFHVSDPQPEIKLLHRFKPGRGPEDTGPWRSFLDKCRLAWGVFFPPPPPRSRPSQLANWAGGVTSLLAAAAGDAAAGAQLEGGRSAKQVVVSRLQMVLIADRCGVSPESLLEMKAQTLTALADYMGKDLDDDVAQLEVQVSALKPSGERITMTIGFSDMLGDEQLMNPLEYNYEFEDDDDYFYPEEEDHFVAEIAEAPESGLIATSVQGKMLAEHGEQEAEEEREEDRVEDAQQEEDAMVAMAVQHAFLAGLGFETLQTQAQEQL